MAETIKNRALEIGFDLAGVAALAPWRDLEFSRQWVEHGYGGEMRYLANPKRDDPRRVLASAKSVVCVGLIYNCNLPYSTEVHRADLVCRSETLQHRSPRSRNDAIQEADGKEGLPTSTEPTAWISRYAWGQDYHNVMRKKLEQLRSAIESLAAGVETRVYIDTGPVVERAFARLSGIGWMGKNTCLINQQKGSWFFLGVVLTNLALAPDFPAPDRCGSCVRCIEACPTGAFVEPYVMDASRCIAYFTIELKASIPPEFRSPIGANVFGCDICQDICPWNSRERAPSSVASGQQDLSPRSDVGDPPSTGRPQGRKVPSTETIEFQPLRLETGERPVAETPAMALETTDPAGSAAASVSFSLFNPALEALASFTEEDFHRIFSRSPIKRVKYRGWLRNLSVAMGNSGDRRFVAWLERVGKHHDPIVREHAEWALKKIG